MKKNKKNKLKEIISKREVIQNTLPFGSKECDKFLRDTYKESVADVCILDEGLYTYIEEYDDVVSSISKLEVRKKTIEHMIQSELKEHEVGFVKDRKVTWKSVEKSSVDTKRLRVEMPEVASAYMKFSSSRVFRMK